MADNAKMTKRDSALVNILGRMADQLQKQDQALENIAARQLELAKALETADYNWKARQIEAEASIAKLQDSFSRYRSDMLSLVNMQDHIDKSMIGLSNQENKSTYALEQVNQALSVIDKGVVSLSNQESKTTYGLEKASQALTGLEARIKVQEKSVTDHFAYSLKQAEVLPNVVSDSYRNVAKLHMDTEKNLGKMHHETQRRLEKLQQDTVRRLMVLDDVESALRTLLIRTEPPEKKPFWFIRLFRTLGGFVSAKLPRLFRAKLPRLFHAKLPRQRRRRE